MTKAVNEAIVRLHDDEFLVRRPGIVRWCCTLQSVISDIEAELEQIPGEQKISLPGRKNPILFGIMYNIRFPIEGENNSRFYK